MPAWLQNGWKAALGAVFGAGVTWGTLNADVNNNARNIAQNKAEIKEFIENATDELEKLKKSTADIKTNTAVIHTKLNHEISQASEFRQDTTADLDRILNLLLSTGGRPR